MYYVVDLGTILKIFIFNEEIKLTMNIVHNLMIKYSSSHVFKLFHTILYISIYLFLQLCVVNHIITGLTKE